MTPAATKPFIAIACGGTGGHLFPGLAVAEQLVKRGCAVTLLISPKEVDQQAVKNAQGVEVVTLPAVALQRGSRVAFLRGCGQSWRVARRLFKARPPNAALAMGGFTSAPPILAARSLGAKTFLHESNSIPGRANRWLARFVDQAFVGFPSAISRLHVREATVTGTPVRAEFRWGEEARDEPAREDARPAKVASCCSALGLDPEKPVLLVMGGSQGASGINEMILSALPILAKRAPHWQWLHLTGPQDADKVKQAYSSHGVNAVVHSFLTEMDLALGAATAAISRAGASALAEMAAMRLPSLLVPFPHAADNHQFYNARAFADSGAAWLLEQKDATPEKVASLLLEQKDATPEKVAALLGELVDDAAARGKIQAALAKWHAPNAAAEIAESILRSVGQTVFKSSKHQAPTSREIPTSNNQKTVQARVFGAWFLALLWMLEVGAWSFFRP